MIDIGNINYIQIENITKYFVVKSVRLQSGLGIHTHTTGTRTCFTNHTYNPIERTISRQTEKEKRSEKILHGNTAQEASNTWLRKGNIIGEIEVFNHIQPYTPRTSHTT